VVLFSSSVDEMKYGILARVMGLNLALPRGPVEDNSLLYNVPEEGNRTSLRNSVT
jgi:hypothetical protein